MSLANFTPVNLFQEILVFCVRLGCLKYWKDRSKVDFLVSNSAVWNDDAVQSALDCAAFWVKDLPFIKSLSGYWKFHLAVSPTSVPENFHGSVFEDSEWTTLPGILQCMEDIVTHT